MPDVHQPTSPTDDGVRDADRRNGEPGVTDQADGHPTGESQAEENAQDDPPA
jgi:hypothetical protein